MDYLFRVQTTVLSTPVSCSCSKVHTWHFPAWDGRQQWLFCELCLSFWFDMNYLGLSLITPKLPASGREPGSKSFKREADLDCHSNCPQLPTHYWGTKDLCTMASPFLLDLVQCYIPTFSVGFVHFSACAFCKHQRRCLFCLILHSNVNQLKNMLCHVGFDKKQQ